MVCHDDVDPLLAGGRHLLDCGDRTVGGDQQARAALGETVNRRLCQSVAVSRAVGDVGVDITAEAAQHAQQDRGRADPVDVVVAVHGDAAAVSHVREDQLGGLLDARERLGRMFLSAAQELPRAARIGESAADENL